MPPRPRRGSGRFVFPVLNRAIQGVVLFEKPFHYDQFLSIVTEAAERYGVRILAYSVMPNHWHLVVWPTTDEGLSGFMQWLTATHAKRWREFRGSTGRGALYQARYKAIAVQSDAHFLRLCRYVERNPLRARLVARAEDWPWTSASPLSLRDDRPRLSPWPVARPGDWEEWLNVPEPTETLNEIRHAIRRGLPFGNVLWRALTAKRLGWGRPFRPPGRPPTGSHAIDPRRAFF